MSPFEYKQKGNIPASTYSGEKIIKYHLIGLVDENGNIDMVIIKSMKKASS